jgi:ubiquinone/menaquinone biosynthesis C-methylase UbiE
MEQKKNRYEFIKKIEKYNRLENGTLTFLIGQTDLQHQRAFYNFTKDEKTVNWNEFLEGIFDEDNSMPHPIDLYERKLVMDIIRSKIQPPIPYYICDFGCSAGYMLREIWKNIPDSVLSGVDIVDSGLIKLHKRNPDFLLFKFDITNNIPFPDKFMDIIVCLNILEHVQNDEKVLEEFYRILNNNGFACIVVPYGKKLYDYYDKGCMHVRRYGRDELIEKAKRAGFRIERHVFLFPLMYIPFFLQKKLNRLLYKNITENETIDKMVKAAETTKVNPIVGKFFATDYKLSSLGIPFGIREFVLLRKC